MKEMLKCSNFEEEESDSDIVDIYFDESIKEGKL